MKTQTILIIAAVVVVVFVLSRKKTAGGSAAANITTTVSSLGPAGTVIPSGYTIVGTQNIGGQNVPLYMAPPSAANIVSLGGQVTSAQTTPTPMVAYAPETGEIVAAIQSPETNAQISNAIAATGNVATTTNTCPPGWTGGTYNTYTYNADGSANVTINPFYNTAMTQ
jgi:hypothetical protein